MTATLRSISFIGAGQMAEALLKGVIRRELLPPAKIRLVDISSERLRFLREAYGVMASTDLGDVLHPCETLILAVKPQDVPGVLAELRAKFEADETLKPPCCRRVISICAGVTTRQLEEGLPQGLDGGATPVIRVMPNMAASVGEAASAVAPGRNASPEDIATALQIMGSVGLAIRLDESRMNAVTGLSGSGPAYVFRLMEAMIAGGEAVGLSPESARDLALQTVLGAAKLALDSKEEPAELRRRVTSPGGTTAAALAVMEKRGFGEMMVEAIKAATKRGEELGNGGG